MRQLESFIGFSVGGKFSRGTAFQPEVQLTKNHAFEMRDHIEWTQTACAGCQNFNHSGCEIKRINIFAKGAFNARA